MLEMGEYDFMGEQRSEAHFGEFDWLRRGSVVRLCPV